jgi:hypothetical protein
MTAWRFRRCPGCGEVMPAGKLVQVTFGPNWNGGSSERRCPRCGFQGSTYQFRVVRERRAA